MNQKPAKIAAGTLTASVIVLSLGDMSEHEGRQVHPDHIPEGGAWSPGNVRWSSSTGSNGRLPTYGLLETQIRWFTMGAVIVRSCPPV